MKADRLVLGGLHRDDFEWASVQYENAGYVLVCFELEADCYHWNAVYVKVDVLEKMLGRGAPTVCLPLPLSAEEPKT
jgi:hypothetical protein